MCSWYPPSPKAEHLQAISISSSYKFRALAAILGIVLFFVLYSTLVISSGYFVYWSIGVLRFSSYGIYRVFFHLVIIAAAVMLLLFTLKFVLKLRKDKRNKRIELPQEVYPQLWAFIHRICQETAAPKPRKIFADPEINAYVNYSNNWLSLFLPIRKDLTIGLGLVSGLQLSEFKAVISHEFGHFSQASMKITSYIHGANTIIHHMIYTRDRWDQILRKWRLADLQFAAVAWLVTPIVWLIRQLLASFYLLLHRMHASLAREMEFHADKVAVRTTGSKAIISALWKLETLAPAFEQVFSHALLATQKACYVNNLYKNIHWAIAHQKPQLESAFHHLDTDSNGQKVYFPTSAPSSLDMYASHPPNDMREKNAKTPFVPCEINTASPWSLFQNPESIQQQMTQLIYELYWDKKPSNFQKEEALEAFIEAETEGSVLSDLYCNTFANRFIHIPESLPDQEPIPSAQLFLEKRNLLIDKIQNLMAPVEVWNQKLEEIDQITKDKKDAPSIYYNNRNYKQNQLKELYIAVLQDKEDHYLANFENWDQEFVYLHLALATQFDAQAQLQARFGQHQAIIATFTNIIEIQKLMMEKLGTLKIKSTVDPVEISIIKYNINNMIEQIQEEVAQWDAKSFVPMPNIDTVEDLQNALLPEGSIRKVHANIFENGEFMRIYNELEHVKTHCQRVEQKSITSILLMAESLLEQYEYK
ncbi:MAG: M48 family metalloprotease [Flavobacteriaceae bacterium]|nr:M48 family metalloprotease [Flavobacteriaceae bacterium]